MWDSPVRIWEASNTSAKLQGVETAAPRVLPGVVLRECPDRMKRKKFDIRKEVRSLARERVGTVPARKVITPKSQRKKPKHKKPPEEELT